MNQLLYPGIDPLQFSPTTHCDVLCIFMAITGLAKADDFSLWTKMGQKTNKQQQQQQQQTRAHEGVVIITMMS